MVLLVLAIAAVAFLLGRGQSRGTDEPTPTARPKTVNGWPGSTRMDSGVPVGYLRSPEGAVAAATDYGTVLSGPLLFDLPNLRRAERVIYAPSSQERLTAQVEQSTFTLEWQQDWKVMDLQSIPGPTPQLGQEPLQSKDLLAQLEGWQEYRHAGICQPR